tara:strand:+ start:141984 stop:142421 length:438 start_codon:yes stop_codon:yes gene_type:complete
MNTQATLFNRQPVRQWHVYESSDRWIRFVRRFAPEFVTGEDHVSIKAMGPITADLHRRIKQSSVDSAAQRIVLWHVHRDNAPHAAAAIAQSRVLRSADVHVAAIGDLSTAGQMALSELGVNVLIRRPEQLPMLRKMVRLHYAVRK